MSVSDPVERFGFGRNWADYIEKNFSKERVEISKTHLLDFLKLKDLNGKSFLDIGCGSGLHSLAAFESGADTVVSFDYDENSVATTRKLHEFAGRPKNWTILQGSVLNTEFIAQLPKSDIVYSWGVLHHTGAMWEAIKNAATPVAGNGIFCIALYTTDVYIDPTPEYWLRIKKQYNEGGVLRKRIMEGMYAYERLIVPKIKKRENPLRVIREYKQSRGMSYWTDVRDWLGGWPMEFAGITETREFCNEKLGFELLNINAGEANTEYVFRKNGAENYWDDILSEKQRIQLPQKFEHLKGHAWKVKIELDTSLADNEDNPTRSKLMLFEDDIPLGFAHVPLSHIEAYGNTRYRHWEDSLYFSTAGNSNPNDNGKVYSYCPVW